MMEGLMSTRSVRMAALALALCAGLRGAAADDIKADGNIFDQRCADAMGKLPKQWPMQDKLNLCLTCVAASCNSKYNDPGDPGDTPDWEYIEWLWDQLQKLRDRCRDGGDDICKHRFTPPPLPNPAPAPSPLTDPGGWLQCNWDAFKGWACPKPPRCRCWEFGGVCDGCDGYLPPLSWPGPTFGPGRLPGLRPGFRPGLRPGPILPGLRPMPVFP
jgi:hypothetical protein